MPMKYRQRGYRDSEKRDRPHQDAPRPPRSPEERQLRHMMERSASLVLRCHQCSADSGLDLEAGASVPEGAVCRNCQAALHSCRNCQHFDTGARWECNAPIEKAVADKTAANSCALYKANAVLDATGKRSGGGASNGAPTSSARAAFENLFKKS